MRTVQHQQQQEKRGPKLTQFSQDPSKRLYIPIKHLLHDVCCVSVWYWPNSHVMHAAALEVADGMNVPGSHGVQDACPV